MSIERKVVAITGVTTGIGRAAARVFAQRGALVVGAGRRTERGQEIADELRGQGHTMTFVTADVTRPDDCARFITAAVEEHGRLDALVNNVGGNPGATYVATEDVTPELFDQCVALNLRSAFFCCQAAVGAMRRDGGGAIVNVSSVVSTQAMAHQVVYAISKAALNHLSRCLAVEYMDDGIRVNSLIIGGAMTKQSARAMDEVKDFLGGPGSSAENLPEAMVGTPMAEITDALILLCSDEARGITAADIAVDRARSAGMVFSAALLDALAGKWTR